MNIDRGTTIESITTRIVDVSLSRPVGTPLHRIESVLCLLVTIRTADGATGTGFCFTIDGDQIETLDERVKAIGEFAIRRSVHESTADWTAAWSAINTAADKGTSVVAFSAIDTAVWDAAGHTLGLSLPKLWGQERDRVDCYASPGFWLTEPIEMLVSEARRFTDLGFKAVKVRVGHDHATDLERVGAVIREVGPEVAVYTDANQSFEPAEAIRRGLALAELGVTWFEEPVASNDFAGHATVRAALPIDVASGETEYTKSGMQQYLDAGSVDILMPDLQRVGGYTEFRMAAAAAAALQVPLSSHFFTEYSLAIAGSHPLVRTIEWIDWFAPLFNESPELVDGQLVIPDRPGHGFTFAD